MALVEEPLVSPAGQPAPGPARGSGQAGGAGPATPDTAVPAGALPTCRICLQEDAAGLERPCTCAGSMAWAHHACIQRWIDEKHDGTCEVCKQPFRGAFVVPPPRPASAPLVAQLQVDNQDRRIVLLADPHTGSIVARVVVPPVGEAGEGDEAGEGWHEEGAGSSGGATLGYVAVVTLLVICVLGALAIGSAGEQGSGSAATTGVWLVRGLLLCAWAGLRGMPFRRQQAADVEYARRQRQRHADLESGLRPRHQ